MSAEDIIAQTNAERAERLRWGQLDPDERRAELRQRAKAEQQDKANRDAAWDAQLKADAAAAKARQAAEREAGRIHQARVDADAYRSWKEQKAAGVVRAFPGTPVAQRMLAEDQARDQADADRIYRLALGAGPIRPDESGQF